MNVLLLGNVGRRVLRNINTSPKQLFTSNVYKNRAITRLLLNTGVWSAPSSHILVIFRGVASEKLKYSPGFIDSLVGVYEDPNYKLDLKPDEVRDGQLLYWVSEIGVMILGSTTVCVIVLCFSMLTWYTLFDSQPALNRTGAMPFMEINSGKDLNKTRNPILYNFYPYGPHADNKVRFYYEIEDAIKRRKSAQQEQQQQEQL